MYKTHAHSDGSQTYAFRFVVKLFYWLTSPGGQYVKPGNTGTGMTCHACFINSECKNKGWCEVYRVITTLAAHFQNAFNQSDYAQVYGDEWIGLRTLRNFDDEPITQHKEVCSS